MIIFYSSGFEQGTNFKRVELLESQQTAERWTVIKHWTGKKRQTRWKILWLIDSANEYEYLCTDDEKK